MKQLKQKILLLAKVGCVMIALAIVVTACSDDGNSSTKNGDELQKGSLVGTKWKLVGSFDANNKVIKEFEPKNCKDCYTIEFHTDGLVTGYSASNSVQGFYDCNFLSLSLKFLNFYARTSAEELYDGNFYMEIMNKIQSFYFTEEKLKLFYNDKKNYLLLERRQ